ncbi:hypothetical protein [Synechococcus sp. FACHB-909]|uniref:hypothetical protein n=1 Tax=Synechococcus sp. FACHB-909 TaxID=2692863 RepID=UPI001681C7C2|nr:hypothetical protein [Synechococcus sp. FACHB-909]MBD2719516.1 hypothetical protein [Synechococcus sp. FACHB-909]
MILLDTNICITIINANPAAVVGRFKRYRLGEIGPCSVVAAELRTDLERRGTPNGPLDTMIAAHALSLQVENWVPTA